MNILWDLLSKIIVDHEKSAIAVLLKIKIIRGMYEQINYY